MRAVAKAEILPFRPVKREAGSAKAPPRRGFIDRLTRLFADILRRRRRARLRNQFQVVDRWRGARKAGPHRL